MGTRGASDDREHGIFGYVGPPHVFWVSAHVSRSMGMPACSPMIDCCGARDIAMISNTEARPCRSLLSPKERTMQGKNKAGGALVSQSR